MSEREPGGRAGRLALLVIDVQTGAVDYGPHRGEEVLANIAHLLAAARAAGVDVIHVQHDGEPGSPNEPGTPGWEIHPAVGPQPGEKVLRKAHNSAFRGTDLREHLEAQGVGTLVLTGIQTDYCVDTTCRIAFEHGFHVVIPTMAHTTWDLGEMTAGQIQEHLERHVWEGRFARVLGVEEVVGMMGAAERSKVGEASRVGRFS